MPCPVIGGRRCFADCAPACLPSCRWPTGAAQGHVPCWGHAPPGTAPVGLVCAPFRVLPGPPRSAPVLRGLCRSQFEQPTRPCPPGERGYAGHGPGGSNCVHCRVIAAGAGSRRQRRRSDLRNLAMSKRDASIDFFRIAWMTYAGVSVSSSARSLLSPSRALPAISCVRLRQLPPSVV